MNRIELKASLNGNERTTLTSTSIVFSPKAKIVKFSVIFIMSNTVRR